MLGIRIHSRYFLRRFNALTSDYVEDKIRS
jgi:hypothetical protein